MIGIDEKKFVFKINNHVWNIIFVDWNDPTLFDRNGIRTYATTNPTNQTIYVSKAISGDFLRKVLLHELTHCVILSHGMARTLYTIIKPEYLQYAEEWCCNLLADHYDEIGSIINKLL